MRHWIEVETALTRAREVQPVNCNIISLTRLPDGQWLCRYFIDSGPDTREGTDHYRLYETPLFKEKELR